jgi:hypothetical protein
LDDVIIPTIESELATGIPLDIAPLLAPYRRHGRLSLRIERLPPQARLNRGNNNGDRTWSLSLDELDGLVYLAPPRSAEPHTLAVRVVGLDGDYGATLALLDLRVSPAKAPPAAAAKSATDDGRIERAPLAALTAAQASLAAREAELAEARQELDRLRAAGQEVETALAGAKVAADAAIAARLAEAEAAAEKHLAQCRAQWQAEEVERRAEWEAGNGQRIEAALAEARAGAAAAAAEQRRLGDELAAAKTALAAREASLAETRASLDHARGEGTRQAIAAELAAARRAWQRELDRRLAEAAAEAAATLEQSRAAWQAEQERRRGTEDRSAQQEIEAARQRWQEEAEAALAQARGEAAAAEAERRRLGDELGAVKQALAAREAMLAETRANLDLARGEGTRQAIGAELAAARRAWEAELERHLAEAAAGAAATLEKSRAGWQAEAERGRGAEDGSAQQVIDAERARWQQEAEAALARAKEAWKADEAKRLSDAETRWRAESVEALAEATARFERAEAALAEARARADGDAIELHFLREELAEVKAVLAARDTESAEPHAAAKPSVKVEKLQLAERLLAGRGETDDAEAEAQRARQGRPRPRGRFTRFAAVVAGVALAVMAYPAIDLVVRDAPWAPIMPAAMPVAAPAARLAQSAPPAAAVERILVGVAVANVRAAPSPTAAVITTLPHDAEVTPVERRGKWVLVRIGPAEGAEGRQGWVFGASLRVVAGR